MTHEGAGKPPHGDHPDLSRLPNLLVIGAMKCGTSALHRLLNRHPDVAMAPGKELNFFIGADHPESDDPAEWWRHGQWHRGSAWYAEQFDASAAVRGESSPGYTGPGSPEVPDRIHRVLPEVRLVYLVRDPLERALSQWRHHRRDGTERRPVEEALLDPDSEYVARSRYAERVHPYLDLFPPEQLLIVVQERLRRDTDEQMRPILIHAGADPDRWPPSAERSPDRSGTTEAASGLRREFWARVEDDVERLRELIGDPIAQWAEPSASRPARGAPLSADAR